MKINRPRTFLEFQVGTKLSSEVVLHVRRSDIDWFNENGVFDDVQELLQNSILPRLFGSEIEPDRLDLGPGGIPLEHKKVLKKRKRTRPTKKELAELRKQEKEDERKARKSQKDMYFAVNDNVRIAYRTQEMEPGCLLKYDDNDSKRFCETKKLSKRIVAWVYPVDMELPPDEGICRPEMIPIASLFRSSRACNDEEEVIEIED